MKPVLGLRALHSWRSMGPFENVSHASARTDITIDGLTVPVCVMGLSVLEQRWVVLIATETTDTTIYSVMEWTGTGGWVISAVITADGDDAWAAFMDQLPQV